MSKKPSNKIKISFKEALGLILPYVKDRFLEQVKSVWLVISYLVLFQVLVLGIPIVDASIIAAGIVLVITGLTFFMEGLLVGLMPLGEVVGIKLPQKSTLPVILLFSLVLGFLATLAEPAIQVLQTAGSAVKPWEAPLLYLLLTKNAGILVYSVGAGVGIAVMFGMLRFLYQWSLKPFIYVLVGILSCLTVYAYFDGNLLNLTGLAWDCGAVTTGPVTVPLVLALGMGISRMAGSADSGASGFGVVTLASLFPILAVLSLGLLFSSSVPNVMSQDDFFKDKNRAQVEQLFEDKNALTRYVLTNAGLEAQRTYFGSSEAMIDEVKKISSDNSKKESIFGTDPDAITKWALQSPSKKVKKAFFKDNQSLQAAIDKFSGKSEPIKPIELIARNMQLAVQAILLLSIPMMLVLFLILREKLPKADEVLLGLFFAIIGMGIFSIGIELGLDKLGSQVGSKIPVAFKSLEMEDSKKIIKNFDKSVVQKSINEDGETEEFFLLKENKKVKQVPYNEKKYNQDTRQYTYIPVIGPLFGSEGGFGGALVVLLFAFILGYGATLAEPALNALGLTVEEITVGTFKKSLLMQTVALGVAVGIAVGVAKIMWDIPLAYLLIPPYMLLMIITKISTEEFVNIAWDSAGVTTGPITVPLVLALGLGLGGQVGVVEGFGILSMASVCPILAVSLVGLNVTRRRRKALAEEVDDNTEAAKVAGAES